MGQPVGDFNIDINIFLLSPVGVAGWTECAVDAIVVFIFV